MRYKNILFLIIIQITLAFSSQAFSANYTYNGNQLVEIDYGNGFIVEYDYDAAGNRISMTVIDAVAPTGSIAISDGAATTNSTSVTLTLSATDNSGTVSQMRFSNDNITWSAWEVYATTKAWTLSEGSGTKTLYVEYKDQFENISQIYSDSIEFNVSGIDLFVSIDSVPSSRPSGTTMGIAYTLQNLGTINAAPFEVRFYLASDPVNTANDVLLRTEYVSDIWPDGYNTTLMIPASTAAGTYYIRAVVDAGNTNAETDESNNSAVSSAITVTKEIDLVVSIDSVPASKPSGSSMAVAYTLQNLGSAKQAPFEVRLYLASDPVNTASDVLLRTENVTEIWPDGYSTTLMIPASTAAGTYYVRAVVDAGNSNSETNENNNSVVSSAITITKEIDLVVSIDSVPESKPAGASMLVAYTLQNLGSAKQAPFEVRLYLASDPVNTTSDVLLRSESVSEIWPDGYSTTLTIPASTAAGTYYVRAVVDAGNTNVETNENNNTVVSSAITVTKEIDLAISSVMPPASATAGDTITVPTTVINNGTDRSVETYVYYYISTDQVISTADEYIGYKVIGAIDGGSTQSVAVSLILPSNLAGGTYYIGAIVDPTGVNTETDNTNNFASSSITLNGVPLNGPIDLAISSITPPASANPGEMITVPVTVINNGTGRSVGSYIYYYLSTDTAITSTDRYLGYHRVVDIDGGWTDSVTASIMLPADIYSGTYYIGVIVDPTNTNAETDETNNNASAAIAVNGSSTGPVDLSISSITPPASANAGDMITVPTTVQNNGTDTSIGTYIYYYLSTDPVITTADTYLGDMAIGGIAGSGSQGIIGSVMLPSNLTSGTYYIGAVVDPADNNVEADETNNTTVSPITIGGIPPVSGQSDLVVTSIMVPGNAIRGTSVTVPVTIVNYGTALSTGTYVYFYLSTDANITPDDGYLASKTVGILSVGGSQNISESVYIPTDIAPGPYYIGVIVDPTDSNAELDETNNTISGLITITP